MISIQSAVHKSLKTSSFFSSDYRTSAKCCRIKTMADISKLTTQAVLYPKRFIEGRLKKPTKTISSLKSGEGAILVLEGKKVAVYKSTEGKINKLSPVCKHLGCIVGFNQKGKTWDCPCHGSRYKADGTVFVGPSKKNLDKL